MRHCVLAQFSCAVRVNYAGVTTEYVHSVRRFYVGIKVWVVSLFTFIFPRVKVKVKLAPYS